MSTPAGSAPKPPQENPMYIQDALFPDTAVQTTGWAQPEPREPEATDDTMAEAA
ncbi:hypothetical protein GCM10009787_12070 [Streptomyces bangladeshensis]|uniref:Uncharacterized protein n=1 Tax=Streptomyces bangladeshensis TaxID=295352 RepID=A0ABN3BD14_9ACTN